MNTPNPPSDYARGHYARQLSLQGASALAVLAVAWPYCALRGHPLPWLETSLAIGAAALLLAIITRQDWWWRTIHALFAPVAFALLQLDLSPHWYLMAFLITYLVYRGALSSRVPLFLSSTGTVDVLADLIIEHQKMTFIDLGAGTGSVVAPLARRLPDRRIAGIENSAIPWLIGQLRTARCTNTRWSYGDLRRIPLADYDVVYAFLSPVPMTALWDKTRREMRSGAIFISNSFAVPDVEPDFVIDVADSRKTRLFCYQI